MVFALKASIAPGELDDLVCVCHQDNCPPLPASYGVRVIPYTDPAGLLNALKSSSPTYPQNHTTGQPSTANMPEGAQGDDEDVMPPTEGTTFEDIPGATDSEHENEEEMLRTEEALPIDAPQMQKDPETEEKIHSAQLIRRWYRQQLRRETAQQRSDIRRLYSICSANAECIECGSTREVGNSLEVNRRRRYLMLIRGPLPHVLVVLDGLLVHVRKAKDDAKRRLTKVQHLELEKVRDVITSSTYVTNDCAHHPDHHPLNSTCRELYNSILEIGKKLRPDSTLGKPGSIFRSGDIDSLRKAVARVASLVEGARALLKDDDIVALESQMAVGFKGIVQEHVTKPTAKRAPRPVLNTEDLDL